MTKISKKMFAIISIIGLIALTLISCEKITKTLSKSDFNKQLKEISEYHNNTLDNFIKSTNNFEKTNFKDNYDNLKNIVKKESQNSRMSNFGDSLFMYNVDSPDDFISKYDNFTDSIKNQNNVISKVVVELEDVLTNFKTEDETKAEIHKIFDKYITLADEMDKQKILVISGTALGSVEYWNNNIQLIESNEQNQRINKLKQVMEFVLADATCGAYGGPAGVICSGLMALSW